MGTFIYMRNYLIMVSLHEQYKFPKIFDLQSTERLAMIRYVPQVFEQTEIFINDISKVVGSNYEVFVQYSAKSGFPMESESTIAVLFFT